jgi:hypothetical protein
MASRIVHFALDDCHRIGVLKSAGYCVDDCGDSLSRLHAALIGVWETDAVVIAESTGTLPDRVVSLVRSVSVAPLILFQSKYPHYDESEFDLIVQPLTPPDRWLSDIGALIEQRRSVHSMGQA